MHASTQVTRTDAGGAELAAPTHGLSLVQRRFLTLLDTPRTFDELGQHHRTEAERLERDLVRLAQLGLVTWEPSPPTDHEVRAISAAETVAPLPSAVRLGAPGLSRRLPFVLAPLAFALLAWAAWQFFQAPGGGVPDEGEHAVRTRVAPPSTPATAPDAAPIATRVLRSEVERPREVARDARTAIHVPEPRSDSAAAKVPILPVERRSPAREETRSATHGVAADPVPPEGAGTLPQGSGTFVTHSEAVAHAAADGPGASPMRLPAGGTTRPVAGFDAPSPTVLAHAVVPAAATGEPVASAPTPLAAASSPIANAATPVATAATPTTSASMPVASASTPVVGAAMPVASAPTPVIAAATPAATASTPAASAPDPFTSASAAGLSTTYADVGAVQLAIAAPAEHGSRAAPATALVPVVREAPAFPREAVALGLDAGTVKARLSIDAKGNVSDVVVVATTHRAFQRAVREALTRWRFQPGAAGRSTVVDVAFKRD